MSGCFQLDPPAWPLVNQRSEVRPNPIELSFSHQRQFTEADTIGEPREEVLNRNGQLSFWLGCDARSSGSAYSIRVVPTKLGDHLTSTRAIITDTN
ncbi:hypothetical protein GS883_21965 [Rhodococcus hoagii]|nr:hypothetical protein [Prescottella equi]